VVWINGIFKSQAQAFIPITDQAVQYGFGLFETLRVDHGEIAFLDAHVERLNKAWQTLFNENPLRLSYQDIILGIIQKNQLQNQTAAVKIMVTRGEPLKKRSVPTVIVMARPYIHRLEVIQSPCLRLVVFPEPRQSPLANHKTTNYLFYLLAGQWAHTHQADEAIILNPDKTVSETNTANILLIQKNRVVLPMSRSVLPGIMENAVITLLSTWGYEIVKKRLLYDDLFQKDQVVMLTNSLMGVVPVGSVDERDIAHSPELANKINKIVLEKPYEVSCFKKFCIENDRAKPST